MANIRKTTIQFNVFHRDDVNPAEMQLAHILEDADYGSIIRSGHTIVGTSPIITDPDVLREELLAIGNDGTFFDEDE